MDVNEQYSVEYSEKKLRNKLRKYGKKAGVKAVYVVLLLFYTLKKPTTPAKAKSVIIGALGYFIFPLDLIPDITPLVGYTDDLGIIIGALLIVAAYIDSETKEKSKEKLIEWFGEDILDEVASVDKDIAKKQKSE